MTDDIKLLVTDFDGTLVDTFQANYHAYHEAFTQAGLLGLSVENYRRCFGLRFDKFMSAMGVNDKHTASMIRELKKILYPNFFHLLQVNQPLANLIATFHKIGGKTAIASTARRENLENALHYTGLSSLFDLILAGEQVTNGKPNPEIYKKVMKHFGISPKQTLIFEDSETGLLMLDYTSLHALELAALQRMEERLKRLEEILYGRNAD